MLFWGKIRIKNNIGKISLESQITKSRVNKGSNYKEEGR